MSAADFEFASKACPQAPGGVHKGGRRLTLAYMGLVGCPIVGVALVLGNGRWAVSTPARTLPMEAAPTAPVRVRGRRWWRAPLGP